MFLKLSNHAATEKSGSAEYGDDARVHGPPANSFAHVSNSPMPFEQMWCLQCSLANGGLEPAARGLCWHDIDALLGTRNGGVSRRAAVSALDC
jgi:hypothetical protein